MAVSAPPKPSCGLRNTRDPVLGSGSHLEIPRSHLPNRVPFPRNWVPIERRRESRLPALSPGRGWGMHRTPFWKTAKNPRNSNAISLIQPVDARLLEAAQHSLTRLVGKHYSEIVSCV